MTGKRGFAIVVVVVATYLLVLLSLFSMPNPSRHEAEVRLVCTTKTVRKVHSFNVYSI